MKHLLNDLSIEEKNRIRKQHEGGTSIDTSKFKKLLENKLGSVRLISEQEVDITECLSRLIDQEKPQACKESIFNTQDCYEALKNGKDSSQGIMEAYNCASEKMGMNN